MEGLHILTDESGAASGSSSIGGGSLDQYAGAKMKLDELFLYWLSQGETRDLIKGYLTELKAGKSLNIPTTSLTSSFLSGKGVGAPSSPTRGKNSPPPRSPSRTGSPVAGTGVFTFEDSSVDSPARDRGSPSKASPLRPQTLEFGHEGGKVEANDKEGASEGPAKSPVKSSKPSELPPTPAVSKASKPAVEVPTFFVPGEGGRGRGKSMADGTLEAKLDLIAEVWRATSAGRPANTSPEKSSPPVEKGDAPKGYEWCEGVCVKTDDLDVSLRVEQFAAVAKTLCGFPSFFAAPLFRRIRQLFPGETKGAGADSKEDSEAKGEGKASERKDGGAYGEEDDGEIKLRTFFNYWRREMQPYDHVDRFFRLVKQEGAPGIVKSDFLPFMEELLAFHPGLAFLESTPEFQEKYARTVIARFFYMLDPLNRRVITARALRRSNLIQAFHTVDMEEDINLVNDFFSYEHFYVLYCKFWELDKDHDFLLSRDDLTPLGGHALTNVILDRIFEQPGRPFEADDPEGRMGFEDFICLLLAEEDKTNEVALAYWFRTIDLDGDGTIQAWEMQHFYGEQLRRMEDLNCEVVPFNDVMCQMHDLLKPEVEGVFTFEDFIKPERVRLTGAFFSVLFNLSKFTAFEQRDPFVVKQEQDPGFTMWDRYAQIEYARLALEEEAQEEDLSLDADDGQMDGWDDDDLGKGSRESPF